MQKTLRAVAPVILFLLSARLARGASISDSPVSDANFLSALSRIQTLAQYRAALNAEPAPPKSKSAIYAEVSAVLSGTDIPDNFIRGAIFDPRTQTIPEIVKLMSAPAEAMPYGQYKKIFLSTGNIARGAAFYRSHRDLLTQIQERYDVDPLILTSLVGVETRWGSYTGKFPVISALFTIAASFPDLSNWACGEIAQYLEICFKQGITPQSILGSYAGAFGYYQFMPSSYNAYAVDFDGDGRKSWNSWPDVLASVANYLSAHGYTPGPDDSPGSPVWRALYSYNHSDNYVRVILEMRNDIRSVNKSSTP
ncbi:MAG: lytic murein transglycosylase [Elusimicrobiota bacterium]